jgi:CRP-like cAMP-binding protein
MKTSRTERISISESIVHAMRRCVFLQPLGESQFEEVVETAHALKLTENSVIFKQGETFASVYLVISGGVKLQRLAPNGDEKVIEIVRPGQTFAEAVLFIGGPRYPVSAVAVSNSVVVAIDAKTYLNLLTASNSLCLDLLGNLSQRLHWMVKEVDRLTLHNATFRLVDYLLSHIPEEQSERTGVRLAAPKNVIASRLSIKPETLSRTLKDLANQGLVRLDGPEIELVDVDKLRELNLSC